MRLRLVSRLSILPVASILFLSLACASTPPPARESPDSSVVGASVGIAQIIGHKNADYVIFVRLDEAGEMTLRADPMPSNFASGGYVFLFNALPGRYAAVAAGYFVESSQSTSTSVGGGVSVGGGATFQSTHNVYLPRELVEKTVVSVGAGDWVFAGEIAVDRKEWQEADELQRHYLDVVAPGYHEMNLFEKAFGAGRHDPGVETRFDAGNESLVEFMETSREIAGSEWADTLQPEVASAAGD